jgi:hypothetical protein
MAKGLTVPAMTDAKKQFADRLKKAMEAAGYEAKPSVLEREFNLKYMGSPLTLHGVRKWLVGESIPSEDKISVLADWLKVDAEQLRTGRVGRGYVQEPRKTWNEQLPVHERETFEAFLALPSPQRKIVREVILAFAKAAG